MRTSILIAGWSLILLLLPMERAAGQPEAGTKVALISPTGDVGEDYKWDSPPRQANLRPNQETPYHIYVRNPKDADEKLTVQLVSGDKGKEVVAAFATMTVPAGKTKHVSLEANKLLLPPAIPPVTGADGKTIASPPPSIKLGKQPRIRVLDAKGKTLDEDVNIDKTVIGDLADVKPATIDGKAVSTETKLVLQVSRKDGKVTGAPIAVKLTPRNGNGEAIPAAKLAIDGNVLEGVLAVQDGEDGAKALQLSLQTEALPKNGFVDVSIDGYARAYVFDFKGAPKALCIAGVPSFATPGKPIAASLIVTDPQADEKFGVKFIRGPGSEEIRYTPARNEYFSVRIGENGEAILASHVHDGTVEFTTAGMYGAKTFIPVRTAAKATAPTPTIVRFDATAPAFDGKNEKNVKAELRVSTGSPTEPMTWVEKKWFAPGQVVRVTLVPTESESTIDLESVRLYMGEKPGADGKAAPGSQVAPGKASGNGYSAEFTIPANHSAEKLKVGIIAANTLGLIGGGEADIQVDPTPPEVVKLNVFPATGKEPDFVPGVSQKEPLASYKPGDTIRLTARAIDPQSQIDPDAPVIFFLGDAPGPDGKDLPTTYKRYISTKGVGSTAADFQYAMDITLPKDIKKETDVKVGVMFRNKAGQYGTRVTNIKLDKDFTTATLTVKVTQGGAERRQPGLKVWLIDQFGAVAAEGKTDDCGIAVFEKVLPGTYLVWAVKETDQNSQDYKTVVARGGDEINVDLSVRRQLAPNIQPPRQPQR
jgi:hypothetical protein